MTKNAESPQIRTSHASPDDAAEILDLQKRAYESEARLYNDWTLPSLTQTLPELLDEFAASVFLKALAENRLVGSVRARETDGLCQIRRLIVEPQFQGRGIGTMLMRHIETLYLKARTFELFTGSRSEGNLRLYERLGYQRVREKVLSPAITLVYLEKRR